MTTASARRWISGSVEMSSEGGRDPEAPPRSSPWRGTVQSQRCHWRPPSRTGGEREMRQLQARWDAVRPHPGTIADTDAASRSTAPHGHRLATAADRPLPAASGWSAQPETRCRPKEHSCPEPWKQGSYTRHYAKSNSNNARGRTTPRWRAIQSRCDPLHAMQFRPAPPPQVRDGRPAQQLPSSDRG